MVTLENSIPLKSDAFLNGIDVMYVQFNDVNFYIEDQDKENFYYEIFKKLFPNIKLTKIFPLNGKDKVLKKALINKNDKKKIFLVDKDFDDILCKEVKQENLFYLKQYSIENYLIEENSIKQYIIEEKPKIKLKEISKYFNLKEYVKSALKIFHDLTLMHIYVQFRGFKIKNTANSPQRFLHFGKEISLKNSEISNYKNEIQAELNKVDKRLKIQAQLKKMKKQLNLVNYKDIAIHVPGKYLISYFKFKIEQYFGLASRYTDSFVYRLARNNDFANLNFFQASVNEYLKLEKNPVI